MLSDPVTHVKGVGEKMGEDFAQIGIHTVEELLNYFPYRYDVFEIKPLSELIHDDKVTIEGRVIHDPSLTFYGKQKSRLTFTLEVEQVAVKAVIFNRAFAKKHIHSGDTVTLVGKWDAHRLQITVSTYKKGPASQQDEMQPVYPAKGELSPTKLKKAIQQALASYAAAIDEILPAPFLTAYKLPSRKEAYQTMHMPKSRIALKHARRRFIYEEFLVFQLKMQLLRKWKREATTGNVQQYDQLRVKAFMDSFPFTLTDAQQSALHQILADMASPYRMNRLLQGDVGSGKTAVAAICLYASVTAGKQSALMVPTEILAEQHYQSLTELFGDRASITLLTGSVKGKKRRERLEQISTHQLDIVVGTHALIQDDVQFADLGFVIVDEQHRFGVEQRRVLREKGLYPDVLFMTATPIPRTLAITAFGDMDVSVINQMPVGRKEIETYWVKESMLDRVLQFVGKHIVSGEQAYVICPLIEESDKLDIQNAVDVYHDLRAYFPASIHIGLMHGRLSAEEKDTVMKQFANNEIHLLVSTTVVEVGVNVPNATIMMIYDAERFGLSQLHQLRGRVGRGEKQSYCILIADPKGETGKERMRIMAETTDGFALSEQDLQLRGPGDFFGKKQSGLPEFKVADMVHDYRALETARKDAQEIIDNDLLETKEYQALLQYVENNFQTDEKLD
ncbi:ATP-dependent DNA helicase RecG [Virgibacillus pantothenticus]|uniref:ATP-dependent DNA helicase RecG n=1 Tax=Virgibacillus pantothenticus TaxID=1473 RepID=UPI001C2358E1|nr:ATP-dependent DNA helicase RecG [Virgibacillus pantothenticus]MBU8565903.1 ATP-dependent DNA helicase RecG [Virgibacillus pantothenticus]MBU8602958.1 ATP-dependent DNA helicase RecG [Virgibacillus pantothenticus]MBU8633117.1 ATP-dependent DNA helicase RecG [Virgibacillus pantothenticus]MBU8644822.1 ATP-dependent DNA helicase RecG [Virgibacillus pantothenticus]MBU8648957.1 ATP-dependent DNA helicase RecG [Virgibacillus pantothenticus]